MSKKNRQSWIRGVKTIAAGFFKKHGQMGAQAPVSTFLISVGFVAVLAFTVLSWFWWWFPYHLFSDEVYDIVVVNAPESFIDYNQYMQKFRDKRAAEYGSRTSWFANWGHMAYFKYHYDGYGWTRFIYKENPALYDFVTFGKWMRENKAYLTVVFPEGFDEAVSARTKDHNLPKPDILTYYRTNSLEYTSMKQEFIDEYLHGYQDYMRNKNGWAFANVVDSRIIDDAMDFSDFENRNPVLDNLGRSFIPLLIFIVILYAAMSIGTNIIAGQKELGTFTGILLTPIPRSAIIAGNQLGVTLKTLIPAFIFTVPFLIIPYYRNQANFAAIFLHLIVLTLFIASLTLLISVINDTVVSAQTAFLPVFLILIAVCVTCIQNSTEREAFYLYLPVYGQFYGIGDALNGITDHMGLLVSSVSTLLLGFIVTLISERLLHNERYTISIDPVTAKEIRQARSGKHTALNVADKITDNGFFIFKEMLYPLYLLGFFQLIAIIPVVISYMRRAEYSGFIADLKGVATVTEVMNKTFEVLGIFMGNPLFLALMTVAYFLMIAACIIHSKRVFRKKSFADTFKACGLPFGKPSKIVKDYILGLLAGFAMMSSVCIILKLTGQIDMNGFGLSANALPVFFINLMMWFPQGASEELIFRGYMIPRFEQRFKKAFCVFFSSVMFSVFHSLNAGYTPLASVNLFLIAVLFALIFLKTGNIWMTCAMHTAWNLSQGNIFGLQVSGNEAHAAVINTSYSADANNLITGGTFGPEGGLAVTAVTTVCMVIVIILLCKSRDLSRNKNA